METERLEADNFTDIDDFGTDIDDYLVTCTYCGGKYDPEREGHTEIDDNEEETGKNFCSPECEANHYRDLGKPIPKQPY